MAVEGGFTLHALLPENLLLAYAIIQLQLAAEAGPSCDKLTV